MEGRIFLPPVQPLDKFLGSMPGTKPAPERYRTRREDEDDDGGVGS